jgi:AcrR family transcriptional regulator
LSTAERRAREKAQRRQEILDAARLEFFERGFHQPTVDDVAARAEVSKGTIYLYFVSKEEILAHLLIEGLDLLLSDMEAAIAPESSPSAECAMQDLTNAYLHFCQSNQRLVSAGANSQPAWSGTPRPDHRSRKRIGRVHRGRSVAGCRLGVGSPQRCASAHGPPPAPENA